MKPFILILVLFISSIPALAQFNNFTLPNEWTKDFKVTVETKGGMLDQHMNIRFTYDSCIYVNRIKSDIKKNSFLMTSKLRSEILKQLGMLKSDTISTYTLSYDKSTTTIGMYRGNELFIVSDDSENNEIRQDFNAVYNYLVSIGMSKKKDRNR